MGEFKTFLKALPALGIMALSTFIVCLSATATQTIAYDLKVDLDALTGDEWQWMFPAFIAGECAAMAFCGAIMDRIGRRIPYLAGSVLFIIGTAIDALSSNMDIFLVGRVIEGVGAGAVIVTCIAQIYFTVDDRKLRYISNGVMSLGFGAGMLFGIFFGKIMLDATGWENYLWILLVLQALFTYPCLLVMRKGENSTMRTDLVGGTILTVLITYFVCFLEKVYLDWHVGSTEFYIGCAIFAVLCIIFAVAEWKIPDSMAHRKLDDRKIMLASLILIVLLGLVDMATIGWMVKISLFTYDMSVAEACPYFICSILGAATTAVAISEVIDRTGHLPWFILTAVVSPLALYYVTYVEPDDPHYLLAVHLYLIGLGIGCLISMLNATIQNRTDKDSNGGFVSYGIAARTAALWMGYNVYQAFTDGVMTDKLGDTISNINAVAGVSLPSDSSLASALLTPMRSSIEYLSSLFHIDLVGDIGKYFAEGVGYGFTIMGIVFCICVLIVSFTLVGRKKLV